MLKQLNVKNFALIQEATVDFDKAYTVITGETGSGKSILLNALHLLLGERADFKVIGSSGDKAIVEATFNISEKDYHAFFEANDIDFDSETIVRREISKQGKSRAFINDVPVQLTLLKEFTSQLVSIHSQYNTLDLKRKEFQLNALDTLAGTKDLQSNYTHRFAQYKSLQKQIAKSKEELDRLEKEKDYNDFQLKEIEELELDKNNFSTIEEQLLRVENASEIVQIIGSISQGLNNDDAIIDQLLILKGLASKLTKLDNSSATIESRIQSVIIELKDLQEELTDTVSSHEEMDEQQRFHLSSLVDKYNRVLHKHRLTSEEELRDLENQLLSFASNNEALHEYIEELEKQKETLHKELGQLAKDLHQNRENATTAIEEQMQALLNDLKLVDTKLQFNLRELPDFGPTGITDLTLLFSANKGIAPVEIEKAASGGELSRVMLAFQQMISEKSKLPTIFFDEIDTGVSGDVAQKIGQLLQKMGKTMQLFAISHLPQVAAKAQFHFKVEKSLVGETVQTFIRPLSEQERVEEIARLMSGEVINEAAISNAKALMNN